MAVWTARFDLQDDLWMTSEASASTMLEDVCVVMARSAAPLLALLPELDRAAVGLHLVVAFDAHCSRLGIDGPSSAVTRADALIAATGMTFEAHLTRTGRYNVFIVVAPTPADRQHRLDRRQQIAALRMMGTAIDTTEASGAAATKWNCDSLSQCFLGGLGEGVDPYYPEHCSRAADHIHDIALWPPEINDCPACHTSNQIVNGPIAHDLTSLSRRELTRDLTFKEDCSNPRATKLTNLACDLDRWGDCIEVHASRGDRKEGARETGIAPLPVHPRLGAGYNAITPTAPYPANRASGAKTFCAMPLPGATFFNVSPVVARNRIDLRL